MDRLKLLWKYLWFGPAVVFALALLAITAVACGPRSDQFRDLKTELFG